MHILNVLQKNDHLLQSYFGLVTIVCAHNKTIKLQNSGIVKLWYLTEKPWPGPCSHTTL
jgi:hypothetical protein